MAHVVVDPVTRIEAIFASRRKSTTRRERGMVVVDDVPGIELILRVATRGRLGFAQRSAASAHRPPIASIRAVENPSAAPPPTPSCCAISSWAQTVQDTYDPFLSSPRARLGRHRERARCGSAKTSTLASRFPTGAVQRTYFSACETASRPLFSAASSASSRMAIGPSRLSIAA